MYVLQLINFSVRNAMRTKHSEATQLQMRKITFILHTKSNSDERSKNENQFLIISGILSYNGKRISYSENIARDAVCTVQHNNGHI